MLTLEVETETAPEIAPKLYYADDRAFLVNWIAEGTDGKLYLVPAEAGGWLRRADYKGPYEELAPVSREKARTIMWFVYGDIGLVMIVGE